MNITTVGSAIYFAKELECYQMQLYRDAAILFPGNDQKMACFNMEKECEKRITLLSNVYEDYTFSDMDAGILSPIEVIDGSEYEIPEKAVLTDDMEMALKEVRDSFELGDRFYAVFLKRLELGERSLSKRLKKIMERRTESRKSLTSF